ncbi:MAG: trimethylamine methyltransferase family protein [Pseudomonadota bacterium]
MARDTSGPVIGNVEMGGRPGGRRGGGRAARVALRQESKAGRVVWPGVEGGAFSPLSQGDMQRIHEAALDLLETLGIGDPTQELLDLTLDKGCTLNEHGRLCFPRSLVEDIVAKACREYVVHARGSRAPDYDIRAGGKRVHFCTAGSAVTTYQYDTKDYRPSTLVDVYDFVRLIDQLDNIHLVGQPIIATDIDDLFEHDIGVLYAQICATEKPLSMSFAHRDHIKRGIEMFDMVLGGEGEFLKKPFVVFGGCPIVSPLRFGEDNLEILIETSQLGLVSDIAVAPQAGATAPAPLAGTLVQLAAETLACLCVVNLIKPGCPMTFAMWPLVSDLRTGAFSGGSGEEAILAAAAVQIGRFYDLPNSVGASMSDSKIPDAQAGYEKGVTTTLAAHAGCNRVCESAGMLGSLMGCAFEQLVIDNDLLGMVLRTVRGIEVNDQTLSLDAIKQVALDPGHYLGHPQTLELMESEYLYPDVGDRTAQGAWVQEGSKDMLERAHQRAVEILSTNYPTHMNPATDAKIRDRFPIRLPVEAMSAASGRW